MPCLLFWNVGETQSAHLIASACLEHDVDILFLAECKLPVAELLREINAVQLNRFYFSHHVVDSSVTMLTRFQEHMITPVFDDGRIIVRRVRPPLGPELIITAAHLASKLRASENDQYFSARAVRFEIDRAEVQAGHQNSIVIGDLNMNPFETPMIAADGFHGLMDKATATKLGRIVQGKPSSFFYNPMWSRLGDESLGPPGTYYYNRGGSVANYFWNTFDQVLFRPGLIPYYDNDDLKVLIEINGQSLLMKDRLNKSISDHLPLVFRINTERAIS